MLFLVSFVTLCERSALLADKFVKIVNLFLNRLQTQIVFLFDEIISTLVTIDLLGGDIGISVPPTSNFGGTIPHPVPL